MLRTCRKGGVGQGAGEGLEGLEGFVEGGGGLEGVESALSPLQPQTYLHPADHST